MWVPRHKNLPGIELANKLARKASATIFTGLKPGLAETKSANTPGTLEQR